MNLTVNNQTVTLVHPTVNQVMDFIKNLLIDDVYYSHMIVDGVEEYGDCEIYLNEHLSSIEDLEVKTKTLDEFVQDNLISAKQYLDRAVPQIIRLTDRFYQNPTDEDWNQFNQLLTGIQWLERMIATVDKTALYPENKEHNAEIFISLQNALESLEPALKELDTVLIADLVLYEILPVLKELSDEIEKTIESEEQHHDLD